MNIQNFGKADMACIKSETSLRNESGNSESLKCPPKGEKNSKSSMTPNTCFCDPRIKSPTQEIDQSTTLLRYTNPYRVIQNARKRDRKVSSSTTQRKEIFVLFDEMLWRLWKLGARPSGVCRVRFHVFKQLYDELTRQTTVTCAERGLFLVRIRGEFNYSTQTYHSMWRDVMEYFRPITEKNGEIISELRRKENELEDEIKTIKQNIADTHWSLTLLEQEKAYERQAMHDWYVSKIQNEVTTMQRFKVLLWAMLSDNFRDNESLIDTISNAEEDPLDRFQAPKPAADAGALEVLKLSDRLQDLINERKVAEGRMKTKKLLKDEILWTKGEISKNKAFVAQLSKSKEPLNFNSWLRSLIEGRKYGEATTSNRGRSHIKGDLQEAGLFDSRMSTPRVEGPQIPLLKWLALNTGKCKCKQHYCKGEGCKSVNINFLVQEAMSEFMSINSGGTMKNFDKFFESYLRTKDARRVTAVEQYVNAMKMYMPGFTLKEGSGHCLIFRRSDVSDEIISAKKTLTSKANPYKIEIMYN